MNVGCQAIKPLNMNNLKTIRTTSFLILLIGVSFFTACLDTPEPTFDPVEQFEKELELIDAYLETNQIEVDTLENFLIRYVMIEEGTGESPEPTDRINITYQGRFLSDEEFDSDTRTFTLNSLIPAWQIMIPEMKVGGTIEFYAPSYYCYGPNGSTSIPPNSPLIFRVTLNEINPPS